MLFEVRLKELYDVVDKFVLCESPYSHTGRKKPLYYRDNQSRYVDYRDKIISLVHKGLRTSNPWVNLETHFNSLVYGLKDAQDQDFIMVCDSDEIPRPESVLKAQKYQFGKVSTRTYYYKFNNQLMRDGYSNDHHRTFGFTKFRYLLSPAMLYWQKPQVGFTEIKDGGWHFTYFYPAEEISQKISDMAHFEYNTEHFRDVKRIQKCIDEGSDLFERPDHKFVTVPLDAPKCVMENQEKYEEYIGNPVLCNRPAAESRHLA
jgi:beta-1,4-mannosyl-glycoprotein beta-1,4-N-acetylglucosaminyltransferase